MSTSRLTIPKPKPNESYLPSTSNLEGETYTSPPKANFLADLYDVSSSRQNLQELMDSFRSGKLKAFGDRNAIDQMENIRHLQGMLARRHFELDTKVNYKGLEDSDAGRQLHDNNMTTLLGNLEELGTAIKCLDSHPNRTE